MPPPQIIIHIRTIVNIRKYLYGPEVPILRLYDPAVPFALSSLPTPLPIPCDTFSATPNTYKLILAHWAFVLLD